MDKELLSKKLNLQVCKKEMITNCLKSFNLPTKYKFEPPMTKVMGVLALHHKKRMEKKI